MVIAGWSGDRHMSKYLQLDFFTYVEPQEN